MGVLAVLYLNPRKSNASFLLAFAHFPTHYEFTWFPWVTNCAPPGRPTRIVLTPTVKDIVVLCCAFNLCGAAHLRVFHFDFLSLYAHLYSFYLDNLIVNYIAMKYVICLSFYYNMGVSQISMVIVRNFILLT